MLRPMPLWILLLACSSEPDILDPDCVQLCDTLVTTCGLESFPDVASCRDGCRFALQEGADVTSYAQCAELADCDAFALVACEHDLGLE